MPKDSTDTYVGQRVREIRRARRLSMDELGAAIGTTYQQVQKYENAANRVPASQLWKIARRLDVDIRAFFPGSDLDSGEEIALATLNRLPLDLSTRLSDLVSAIANAGKA